MLRLLRIARFVQINTVLIRHGLTRPVVGRRFSILKLLSYLNPWSFSEKQPRGVQIRIALEKLGPVFVKFGQVLSTRHDLLPEDIAKELAKLQDQVPPFPSKIAKQCIEKTLKMSVSDCFQSFSEEPLASASIAQVHAAKLHDGSDVIVKVLRPNIEKTIQHDIALMYTGAKLVRSLWRHGKRLRPVELVAEFERCIEEELDLMREAANASQLRRNFINSSMMYVPKIYWQYIHRDVMVMERIRGIRISDIDALRAAGTNLKKLAAYGVEIFFTQVLRDSFFHADMHPGNLFVDATDPENPKYLGVDFGIMGTLSPSDQRYLAENLLAFFQRDYRKVAVLHVESGWVPPKTRIDQFESSIRTVCEPIFEKPLKDISFGKLLLHLFKTAERFNMEVQPQLMLLQKTLLNIEGLGRRLYPELDLWNTAKPFIEKWMRKQHGFKKISQEAIRDLPISYEALLKTPRLLYQVLQDFGWQQRHLVTAAQTQKKLPKQSTSRRAFIFGAGFALAITTVVSFFTEHNFIPHISAWQWGLTCSAIALLVLSWIYPTPTKE